MDFVYLEFRIDCVCCVRACGVPRLRLLQTINGVLRVIVATKQIILLLFFSRYLLFAEHRR